jgi:hypothetical protein
MDFVNLGPPELGIRIYKSTLGPDSSELLNQCLTDEQSCNKWSLALVGYEQVPDESYRNCQDFKMGTNEIPYVQDKIVSVYEETISQVRGCVEDYSRSYGISMNYMEAVNFVKYKQGTHFSYHSDHAHHYVCTISTIAYYNDNYEGGELSFDKLNLKLKPTAGDVIVFPSTFIYSHASLPVITGTKYAAVTMFDYNNEYSSFRRSLLKGQIINRG